jgi:hypothetical protein
MMVPTGNRKFSPRPIRPTQRKIAILGTYSKSLKVAPFHDPSWEIWAHASAAMVIPNADRFIDIHPPHVFQEGRKNAFADYYGWLKTLTIPIFMQKHYPEIPASLPYPYSLVKAQWPGVPLGSQAAYLIAAALMEGVTHLGFWGIAYDHEEMERADQRLSTERWAGIAQGMGVQIVCPRETPFLHEPAEDYGYETHSTPEKAAAYKAQFLDIMKRAREGGRGPLVPSSPAVDAVAATLRESDARFEALRQATELLQFSRLTPASPAVDAAAAAIRGDNAELAAEVRKMRENDPPMPEDIQ